MDKSEDLTLVGYTQKPFGLLGELKIKPATFDIRRHSLLKNVFFKKRDNSPAMKLLVVASREHRKFWYLKFKGFQTPESLRIFCNGLLLVSRKDRLPLPQNGVYHCDIIGFECIDSGGKVLGLVKNVLENPAHSILVIDMKGQNTTERELLIPWVDKYVKGLDTAKRVLFTDISGLEDLDAY